MGRSDVITEKQFALFYSSFWDALCPMTEEYVRTINGSVDRFAKPVRSDSLNQKRGLINELSFLLAGEAARTRQSPYALRVEEVEASADEALHHVSSLRAYNRQIVTVLDEDDTKEARVLAGRLLYFLRTVFDPPFEFQPRFPGCGLVEACSGDVFADETLIEVKAGGRNYRSVDLRQLLTYCALNFASKERSIGSLCLVNPRRGVYFNETLDRICEAIAGRPGTTVLAAIVDQLAEPYARYSAST